MDDVKSQPMPGSGISATERETGLSKDILRVWERRYGFPNPLRNLYGERVYQPSEIEKLRLLKQLLDRGRRPAKLMQRSIAELRAELEEFPFPSTALEAPRAEVNSCFEAVKEGKQELLKQRLSWQLLHLGLTRFVIDIVAPLNLMVGQAWSRGEIEVFQEHLYTANVEAILRASISAIPPGLGQPRVLLTTLPNEMHGLGLLMAEAMLTLQGCACIALGVQTPITDIVEAAKQQDADIVALSFSGMSRPSATTEGLRQLRSLLPAGMELWAGGSGLHQVPSTMAGITIVMALQGPEGLDFALTNWRARRGPRG